MKPITKVTSLTLGIAIIVIIIVVMREALGGTTFRAADHATYDECMRNIPAEWLLGSLERTRAESACHYEMQQRVQRGEPR
ncbi:hypothetical protein BH23GEM9_BH23GEM9_31930 [soil metagenome]